MISVLLNAEETSKEPTFFKQIYSVSWKTCVDLHRQINPLPLNNAARKQKNNFRGSFHFSIITIIFLNHPSVVFSGLEIFPEIFGNFRKYFRKFPRAWKNWKFLEIYFFIQKQDRDEGDRPFHDLNH